MTKSDLDLIIRCVEKAIKIKDRGDYFGGNAFIAALREEQEKMGEGEATCACGKHQTPTIEESYAELMKDHLALVDNVERVKDYCTPDLLHDKHDNWHCGFEAAKQDLRSLLKDTK